MSDLAPEKGVGSTDTLKGINPADTLVTARHRKSAETEIRDMVATIQTPMALAMARVFLRQLESLAVTARVLGPEIAIDELNKLTIALRQALGKNSRGS